MEWIPVSSQAITQLAYDSDQEVIFVEFVGVRQYLYGGCGAEVWDEFMRPETSKGGFVNGRLKPSHPWCPYSG